MITVFQQLNFTKSKSDNTTRFFSINENFTIQDLFNLSESELSATIKDLGNLSLKQYGIEIILQRDLSLLLAENRILNEVRDISWLREQVATSAFDLYLVINQEDKFIVFGCIQSKTSIRDRVTRDREPSMIAMSAYFMSVAIVLDGDFLRLPKFRNMVNDNSPEYPLNGWHGMYVLSNKEMDMDRIHSIDVSMGKFVNDVVEGANFWTEQRQWFNHTWKPQVQT